ncbi:MAG: hypothetical protein HOP12_03790 [Candidatus Eisenbacteria bacterium]|uniref:Tetratricopeptide repeat protein n=1 Tax=Eiseniibacteriota bacterium TaxID=2212470 RepID=A0A849SI73_UNCEI|nr:hypothetical protein [Candidatus Eisenbacteria bacterium]
MAKLSGRVVIAMALGVALALASCAGPDRLARQSEEALERGDLRKAYEKARRALDKSPENPAARNAFAAVATQMSDDYKGRILRLAPADTVVAARKALEFRELRAEFARYPVTLPGDAPYLESEQRIVRGAAGIRYREATQSLRDGRPKEAVRRFEECAEFVPGFRDVDRRIPEAFERAVTRIAVLPFDDQVEVPGLAMGLATRIGDEVRKRAGSPSFRFTRVLPIGDLEDRLTVSQARGLTRDQAITLGRQLGAQRVVWGRVTGLRTNTTLADESLPIWRRSSYRDTSGTTQYRWEREYLRVIDRERVVSVSSVLELIDVKTGEAIVTRVEPREAIARIVWSKDLASGGHDDYALYSGDQRRTDSRGCDAMEKRFKERYGDRSLPTFLDGLEENRDVRGRYRPDYRSEFYRDTRRQPVFLGELPHEDELVWVALRDLWNPVYEALRELDPQD